MMSTLLVLALVAAAPTVQQKQPIVQLTPAEQLSQVLGSCLVDTPDKTKTLAAGKKSVSIEVPNVTAVPSIGGDAPPGDCAGFIAQIEVPSSSTAPTGYSDKIDIGVTAVGTWVPQQACESFESSIGIYKVKADGTLQYKGGGSFVAKWDASKSPGTCVLTQAPGWESVATSVPDSGTAKWRIIVRSGGNVTVKATRRKK